MSSDREDLERTVTMVMDNTSRAVSKISNRLFEISMEMWKLLDGGGRRNFDPGDSLASAEKMLKIFCPKFDGTKPEGWIFLTEEYFEYHDIKDGSKVRIARLHMEGAALDWVRRLKKNNMLSTWEKLLEELLERFGDSKYEDSLAVLTRLQ